MPVKKPEIVAGTDAEDPMNVAAFPAPAPDPFNAEALRLPPDFEQMVGVRKLSAMSRYGSRMTRSGFASTPIRTIAAITWRSSSSPKTNTT